MIQITQNILREIPDHCIPAILIQYASSPRAKLQPYGADIITDHRCDMLKNMLRSPSPLTP
jgi:hypothetical protein